MKKSSFFLASAVMLAFSFSGSKVYAQAAQAAAPTATAPASQLTKNQQQAKDDVKLGDAAKKNHAPKEAIADYKAAIEADPANQDAHVDFIQTTMYERFYAAPTKKKAAASKTSKKSKTKKKLTKEQEAAQKAKQEAKDKQAESKNKKIQQKAVAKLLATYDKWLKKNPRQAMFYWAKGEVYDHDSQEEPARTWYQKAVALDPNCAPAWADLADIAAVDGSVAEQRQDSEKALALDPEDHSGVFLNYALTYLTTDPAKYRQLVDARATKYPKDLDFLLMLAAENATSAQDEEALYEEIYKIYGPHSAHPSDDINGMMPPLFNLYAKDDPAKALSFAQRMQKDESEAAAKRAAADKAAAEKAAADKTAKADSVSASKKADAKPERPFWQTIAEYQKSIIDANALIARKKYSDAEALLATNELKVKGEYDTFAGIDQTSYQLAKSAALAGSGGNQKAYDNLKTALLPKPNDSLEAALISYGAKLGKNPAQVRQDVWQAREANAKPFTPFDLKQYVTNKEFKLADFRGKVVLVNFWFPG